MTIDKFQYKTLSYIIDQIELLHSWKEIQDVSLYQSLVLDATKTLDKLRIELLGASN